MKSRKGRKKAADAASVVKAEVKDEVKGEFNQFSIGCDDTVKGEGGHGDVKEIDYTNELVPDFTKVPEDIIKNEM